MKHQMQIKLVFPKILIASIFLVSNAAKAADTAPYLTDSVFTSIGTDGLSLGYGKRFNSKWGGRAGSSHSNIITVGVRAYAS